MWGRVDFGRIPRERVSAISFHHYVDDRCHQQTNCDSDEEDPCDFAKKFHCAGFGSLACPALARLGEKIIIRQSIALAAKLPLAYGQGFFIARSALNIRRQWWRAGRFLLCESGPWAGPERPRGFFVIRGVL